MNILEHQKISVALCGGISLIAFAVATHKLDDIALPFIGSLGLFASLMGFYWLVYYTAPTFNLDD